MSAPTSIKQIEALIEQDTIACQALLDLLNQERDALKERDIDALEQIVGKKADCLTHLEKSASVRMAWSQSYADNNPEVAWDTLLTRFNSDGLKTAWQKLKSLFSECQTANEVNGKILARNQQTFSRILTLMRGQSDAPKLYTSSGNASNSGGSNIVGEA